MGEKWKEGTVFLLPPARPPSLLINLIIKNDLDYEDLDGWVGRQVGRLLNVLHTHTQIRIPSSTYLNSNSNSNPSLGFRFIHSFIHQRGKGRVSGYLPTYLGVRVLPPIPSVSVILLPSEKIMYHDM